MLTNGCTHELFLVFPSAGKASYNIAANGALPPGYRFLAATLDPERSVMGTTSAYKIMLDWQCVMKRDPNRKTSYGKGRGRCTTTTFRKPWVCCSIEPEERPCPTTPSCSQDNPPRRP